MLITTSPTHGMRTLIPKRPGRHTSLVSFRPARPRPRPTCPHTKSIWLLGKVQLQPHYNTASTPGTRCLQIQMLFPPGKSRLVVAFGTRMMLCTQWSAHLPQNDGLFHPPGWLCCPNTWATVLTGKDVLIFESPPKHLSAGCGSQDSWTFLFSGVQSSTSS
ncbi:hypothetical protein BV22DRAFT_479456 [Leucogyrophana mollusca]|uniref:Uncharacterized protein n=1 Tax=Leucogyrophana mollusca TaxID=85980 RepID=A0ACB8BHR5_9AGAM|nr:hypothetical protein BV22DRAFT_479456 [Leucogyrophana mollusca]